MITAVLAAMLVALAFMSAAASVRAHTRDLLLARTAAGESGSGDRIRGRPRKRVVVSRRVVLGAGVVGGLGAGWLLAGPPGGLAGLAVGGFTPLLLERRRRVAGEALLTEQLADATAALSGALRAGLSLSQALAFAADESGPPLGHLLRQVVHRESLGIPLHESIAGWAESERNPELRLVAGVLQLHHRTGGDLPAVLDQVARTIRQRHAASSEVRSLTAQSRLSAIILGLLPLGFFLFLSATSRQDMAAAYRSPAGRIAIGLGLALQGIAFVWIRRLLRVEAR